MGGRRCSGPWKGSKLFSLLADGVRGPLSRTPWVQHKCSGSARANIWAEEPGQGDPAGRSLVRFAWGPVNAASSAWELCPRQPHVVAERSISLTFQMCFLRINRCRH